MLWQARWSVGGRDLNVVDLWREISRHSLVRELVVHVLVDPEEVLATFAALDDPKEVADAIGFIFDDILTESRPVVPSSLGDWSERWTRGAEQLPRHVRVWSPMTMVDPYNPRAFSIFAAG